jgi:ribosome biogenesis GTPase
MELVVDHSNLDSWGYSLAFSSAFRSVVSSLTSSLSTSLGYAELAPARVVSDLGARLEVADATHPARLAQLSGRLRHTLTCSDLPAVGDWVAITAPSDDPGEPVVIHGVLPRRTQLIRRAAGRAERSQVIAANVDTFLIVTSANRDANARRLERYLAAVWNSGAAPIVVVSKIDLVAAGDVPAVLEEITAAAPGVPVVPVSAHTGAGFAELSAHLRPGWTVALIGSSGVGKSSLVNRWLGRDAQWVALIDDNDRGRHATTRRELFALPGGGLIIDTPGMREFGLIDTDIDLDDAFGDIAEIAATCRFRDCQHGGEPGCAVDAAIDTGELDPDRLASLHKLERELAAAERRRDPVASNKERAKMRAINRALRARTLTDPKHRR